MTVELALSQITEVLRSFGEDVNEGQPEQVAGRWVGNGFEDPDEVRAWLEAGIVDPEEARTRVEQGERPARSPVDREPQGPGSPP